MNPLQNEAPSRVDNPFFHRGPIRDPSYFFGRAEETLRTLDSLRNHQCVSIVGPRRIGKTSLLLHLCNPRVQRERGLGEEYLFVYIDCQGLGDLDKPLFYQWLWQETSRALIDREKADAVPRQARKISVGEAKWDFLSELREILTERFNVDELRLLCSDLGVPFEDLPGEGKTAKARELIAYLERRRRIPDLIRVGGMVRKDIDWGKLLRTESQTVNISSLKEFRNAMMEVQEKGYKLVFLFDEFETITLNCKLDESLFSELRSLAPPIVYGTASHLPLYDLTCADKSVLSSPFFNIFFDITLGFLKPIEAGEMIHGLLQLVECENLFDKNDLDVVFELGGHWPFFLQLACYHLFELKTRHRELTEANYESLRQDFAKDAEAHFRYTWRRLSEKERQAVRLAWDGKLNRLDDDQRRRLDRECILNDGEIFSEVFMEFEPQRIAQLNSEDYLRAADSLGEEIERLGRKEARLDFKISERRLRQAIRSEEEAIIELDDLARRYLDSSFFKYVSEPNE